MPGSKDQLKVLNHHSTYMTGLMIKYTYRPCKRDDHIFIPFYLLLIILFNSINFKISIGAVIKSPIRYMVLQNPSGNF
jgi:hypothetical protein